MEIRNYRYNDRVMERATLPSSSPAHPAAAADKIMADAVQSHRPPARATPTHAHTSCYPLIILKAEPGEQVGGGDGAAWGGGARF